MNNNRTILLNINEAADYMKEQKSIVYKLCKDRYYPALKIGRTWLIHKRLLDEWMIRHDRK